MDWNGLRESAWWLLLPFRHLHMSGLMLVSVLFVGFVLVLVLSLCAAATARLAIDTTVRFYWQCTLIFAVAAISSALFMRFRS